jgi:hypothetical protein
MTAFWARGMQMAQDTSSNQIATSCTLMVFPIVLAGRPQAESAPGT